MKIASVIFTMGSLFLYLPASAMETGFNIVRDELELAISGNASCEGEVSAQDFRTGQRVESHLREKALTFKDPKYLLSEAERYAGFTTYRAQNFVEGRDDVCGDFQRLIDRYETRLD